MMHKTSIPCTVDGQKHAKRSAYHLRDAQSSSPTLNCTWHINAPVLHIWYLSHRSITMWTFRIIYTECHVVVSGLMYSPSPAAVCWKYKRLQTLTYISKTIALKYAAAIHITHTHARLNEVICRTCSEWWQCRLCDVVLRFLLDVGPTEPHGNADCWVVYDCGLLYCFLQGRIASHHNNRQPIGQTTTSYNMQTYISIDIVIY